MRRAAGRAGAGAAGRPRLACMADAAKQAAAPSKAVEGGPLERSSRCRMAAGQPSLALPHHRAGAAKIRPKLPKTSLRPADERARKEDLSLGLYKLFI